MKLLDGTTNIQFMGWRKLALALSVLLVLASVASLATRQLAFGIDFTGGTLIEVGYPASADLAAVRSALAGDEFGDPQVQHFGTSRDVLIRVPAGSGEDAVVLSELVMETLQAQTPGVEKRRAEFVGPQVGKELTEQGGLAMLYALAGILVYVWLRFEYRFALGAILALVHDVMITLGVFSIWQLDFDLTVLAAVLAVIGYSLNDTIVVFDRIRENFRKIRKGRPEDVINHSINQTLARTLMTSLTTLMVLGALFLVGGEVIHSFSLALIVGVVVGTYSSIFVASAALLMMGVTKQDLMEVRKEGAEIDDRP